MRTVTHARLAASELNRHAWAGGWSGRMRGDIMLEGERRRQNGTTECVGDGVRWQGRNTFTFAISTVVTCDPPPNTLWCLSG